jgi:hypothetical protein
MNEIKLRTMKITAVVALALVGIFSVTDSARADGIVDGETVPSDEVIREDIILVGITLY